jgi:gamma-glutamylaminecyclotransferase
MPDQDDHILIFVYGTLKKDHANHQLLESSSFIGNAITESAYPMICSNGVFPYLFEMPGTGYNIFGEVYQIDYETLQRLDWLEGVPDHYYRKSIKVSIDAKTNEVLCYFAAHEWDQNKDIKLIEKF